MTPDAEKWDQLQALFHLAEESPEADLDQLLRAATDDPTLREQARALIEASRSAAVGEPLPGAPILPDSIGPYAIQRHLGTGGIGTVYLVERIVGGAVQRSAPQGPRAQRRRSLLSGAFRPRAVHPRLPPA